jgi:hypothetical protein
MPAHFRYRLIKTDRQASYQLPADQILINYQVEQCALCGVQGIICGEAKTILRATNALSK